MSIVFYLTFIYLFIIVYYYFIYLKNMDNDNLFAILINIIFLCILPIYYCFFKSISYSIVFGLCLLISAYYLNIRIEKTFHTIIIAPLIYYFITCIIFGFIIFSI